jgi:hypothetical protein
LPGFSCPFDQIRANILGLLGLEKARRIPLREAERTRRNRYIAVDSPKMRRIRHRGFIF